MCGTDRDICAFHLGSAPRGADHFILGHESLAEVCEAGEGVEDLRPGDLAVGRVRLPCSDPACQACLTDNQDFCTTLRYREHGIKDLDGFMADYVVEDRTWLHPVPRSLREVGVLVEPLTIAEKAFHQATRVRSRLPWAASDLRALVLGAGPVGLLGAMKLVQEGYRTYVYSRDRSPNPSASIASRVGATYVCSQEVPVDELAAELGHVDLVYEALGAAQVAFDVLERLGPNGVFVFTGIPRDENLRPFRTFEIISNFVLKNQVVMGIVNAGRQAFADAIRDLEVFHRRWPGALEAMITGRFPIEEFREPVMGRAGGIKNVIALAAD